MSKLAKGKKALETTRNARQYMPSFFNRTEIAKTKKHVAWCMQGVPPELLVAFDVAAEWPENFGALSASTGYATKNIEAAEAEGYGSELCSYLLNTMGYLSRKEQGTVEPEAPQLAEPTMMLGSGYACEPRYKWFQAASTHYNHVPVHISDPLSPPYTINAKDERVKDHYLDLMRRDIHRQIEFLEEQTGEKLDVDKLRTAVKYALESDWYFYQAMQFNKDGPCIWSATDYFMAINGQLWMMGTEESANFFKALYEEMKEKAELKKGVIEDEKHRFLWFGIPPWYNLGLFNYLEDRGVTFPFIVMYHLGKSPEDIDLSDPVEAIVQKAWYKAQWVHEGGAQALPEAMNPSPAYIFLGTDEQRRIIRDFKIDGAIMHRTRTCRAVTVGQLFNRDILTQAGLKSLVFESDMADPRSWSDEKILGQIEAYLETLN